MRWRAHKPRGLPRQVAPAQKGGSLSGGGPISWAFEHGAGEGAGLASRALRPGTRCQGAELGQTAGDPPRLPAAAAPPRRVACPATPLAPAWARPLRPRRASCLLARSSPAALGGAGQLSSCCNAAGLLVHTGGQLLPCWQLGAGLEPERTSRRLAHERNAQTRQREKT